jgi:hypothetical protein
MIYSLIFIVFGIYIGQEYNMYLPNVKDMTTHLISNFKEQMENNKHIQDKVVHISWYEYIKKLIP